MRCSGQESRANTAFECKICRLPSRHWYSPRARGERAGLARTVVGAFVSYRTARRNLAFGMQGRERPHLDMTREGYGQAYQQGFDRTLRFLRSRGLPWEHASEVTQAAWAKGWERLEQLRNESMVVTWVNTIALNVHRRARRSEPAWQVLPELGTMPGVNLAAIDMARILSVSRPGDRLLLEQQMSGLSPREIARMRGIPESTIRIRLLRARRAARSRIAQASQGRRFATLPSR